MIGEGKETSPHGELWGAPLDMQGKEEVSALSTVILYKQQLEEMYVAMCQAHGDLPYDVLLEGEETCDGWEEELYEQISFRQRDAIDRAWAIAVFYNCVEMLQQVKDMFAGLLARRHASGLPDTETWAAAAAATSSTTSSTTPISSTTAITALISTTITSTEVNTVVLPTTTSTTITSLSMAAMPSNILGCVQQRELLERADDAWGLEEGSPPCVGFADRLRSNALRWRGCKGLEEGQGPCGENDDVDGLCDCSFTAGDAASNDDGIVDINIHDDDKDDTVDGLCDCGFTAGDAALNDDGPVDINNNNNHLACNNTTCNNNKHGDDVCKEDISRAALGMV
ncbi:hypothetical protein CBR_g50127 [Chara braunii]|uniref:Uncharacterized protein n=1 Tax=Chara braunii TaxID=69332 RepID=A0A388M624_CHABU|nr:hypothetical protein CBR_g50127 [Chara braunii]|eukprot:GBG90034.1 hypothetical protein CBR_g50127 [Chara braunii]